MLAMNTGTKLAIDSGGLQLLVMGFLLSGAFFFFFRPGVRATTIRLIVASFIGALSFLTYEHIQNLIITAEVRHVFVEAPDLLGHMIEMFGVAISTIYALLFAFMVLKSMQDFDSINFSLRDEAANLEAISTTLTYLHHEWRRTNVELLVHVHSLLIQYTDGILSDEFRRKGFARDNQGFIDSLSDQIGRLRIENENDRVVMDRVVSRIETLAQLRSRRIGYILTKPSPYMMLMLVVLSVFVVTPYYLPISNSEFILRCFAATLAFVLSFLFLMMIDMTSHFEGYWTVDRSPFMESRERIEAHLRRLQTEFRG